MIPRACLTCQFFALDYGEPGYSEMTPGSPPSISCYKNGKRGCAWSRDSLGRRVDYGTADAPSFITRAENCKFYEPHPALAAAKGKK